MKQMRYLSNIRIFRFEYNLIMIRFVIATINLVARHMWLYSPLTVSSCSYRAPYECFLTSNERINGWVSVCIWMHIAMFLIDWRFEHAVNLLPIKLFLVGVVMHGFAVINAWVLIELFEPMLYVIYHVYQQRIEHFLFECESRMCKTIVDAVNQKLKRREAEIENRALIQDQVRNEVQSSILASLPPYARYGTPIRSKKRLDSIFKEDA